LEVFEHGPDISETSRHNAHLVRQILPLKH
jgi:hypothetical protein